MPLTPMIRLALSFLAVQLLVTFGLIGVVALLVRLGVQF